MSIIYDYLKQIHEQKESKKATPEVPPVKKGFQWSFLAIIAAAVLGCLLLAVGLYFFISKAPKATPKVYQAPIAAPASKTEKSDPDYTLEGIIYNPSRPFAIINGKMLEKSGRVGDFEVTEITPDSVFLTNTKDNTSRTLHL